MERNGSHVVATATVGATTQNECKHHQSRPICPAAGGLRGGRHRGLPAPRGAAPRRRRLVRARQRQDRLRGQLHPLLYKPQPLRTLEEIRADILALEKETEGLLGEIIGSTSTQ